jgi:AmmeMemoRadiSam system protein A
VSAPALSPEDRRALLALARQALRDYFAGRKTRVPDERPALRAAGGAFVTLRAADGELRGCVGRLEADDPLAGTVARMAVVAATSDGRFDPVRADELPELAIEISALGPMNEVAPSDVVVGRDGLLVRGLGRQGVLLPQVAAEHGWDRETFLARVCQKAGLPAETWRGNQVRILAFTATVFGERDPDPPAGDEPP